MALVLSIVAHDAGDTSAGKILRANGYHEGDLQHRNNIVEWLTDNDISFVTMNGSSNWFIYSDPITDPNQLMSLTLKWT